MQTTPFNEEFSNGNNQASVSNSSRWAAVLSRRDDTDDIFLYGVKSTGIYCRPTCGARRPKSEDGVEFFDTAEAAEDAGYRECLRCRPKNASVWQAELKRVQQGCRILERDAHDAKADISLAGLAKELADVSSFHLQKSFKSILGISPRQYLDAVRLRKFKAMLHECARVGDAARDSGLMTPAAVYGRKAMDLALSPSDYKAGAPGAEIYYATASCPLGLMLLAATERGICSVKIGNSREELAHGIVAEFPKAKIQEDASFLGPYLLAALSAMGDDEAACAAAQDLPLDIRATAFQWRVWLALRQLDPGATVSYGQLAAEIGAPGAARAVGTACGANPVALAIPCHRVTHGDGSISGYRWGPDRKRALLDHEKNVTK